MMSTNLKTALAKDPELDRMTAEFVENYNSHSDIGEDRYSVSFNLLDLKNWIDSIVKEGKDDRLFLFLSAFDDVSAALYVEENPGIKFLEIRNKPTILLRTGDKTGVKSLIGTLGNNQPEGKVCPPPKGSCP